MMRFGPDQAMSEGRPRFEGGIGRRQLLAATVALLASVTGAAVPFYVGAAGDGVVRLMALPAIIGLGFLFVFSRKILFLLIIFFRAVCDPVFEATRFGADTISIGGIVNALVILMALLYFLERPRAVSRVLLPMWVPLMLAVLIAAFRAPELGTGIRYFLVYLSYAAVFTVPFYLKECRQDLGFCIRFVVLSSVLPALYGFVDFALGGDAGESAGRIKSTFEHPNIFAFYLVLVISLVLYLLKNRVRTASLAQRCLLVAYMGALLVLLLLTKTRSAWAACLFVFLVYGAVFERRFLIYLLVGGGLLLLVPAVHERLLDLRQGNGYMQFAPLNSYAWRKAIWEAGLKWMRLRDMLLGYGLESFRYYSPMFFPMAGAIKPGAHSVYVQWLFEAGAVGLLCAAWLFHRLLSILRLGFREDKLGTVILMTIVFEYLVVSYSDNMLGYLSFNWYFWFLMGTACAVRMADRTPAQERPGASAMLPPNQTGTMAPHRVSAAKGGAS
jgi:O-antigen ligase